MTEALSGEDGLPPLQSVDEARPSDQGGPIARAGFNYQDEIAVSLLLEMLESPSVLKVHCETHDDTVVIRASEGTNSPLAEFVQVKANELDKLWSIADLCRREDGRVGTSVYEKSLGRDRHLERARFRLVTLRPVVSELEILKLPFDARARGVDEGRFKRLQGELDQRCPDTRSMKGNGAAYWLENCFWEERHSEQSVQTENLLRLFRISSNEDRRLLWEHGETLLQELRAWVKTAGDAHWDREKDKKTITREALCDWWDRRTHQLVEGAKAISGGKLREKMAAAGLPEQVIGLAVELRLDYARGVRTASYMEPEERERLQRLVKSEVQSLQAHWIDGRLIAEGVLFHSLCLDRMDSLTDGWGPGSEDRAAFLKGCMYDIADRCLLRFVRETR